jgi:hypothetical protein
MAFKLFGRAFRRRVYGEPMEMGAVQEDEDNTVQVEPGQPVPYEATSWLPHNGETSHYQRGSADIDPPEEVLRKKREAKEAVHVLKEPPAAEVRMSMIHECLNCGCPFKVPRRRPVKVICPDCGEDDTLK